MRTPEWQIDVPEYLARLAFTDKEFEERLKLPKVKEVKKIVPLRDIFRIASPPIPVSLDLLLHLVRKIKTIDGRSLFEASNIQMVRIDPHHLKIGQKFVYRENYLGILEEVPDIFDEFLLTAGGFGSLGAYFVFGFNENGDYSLACYTPPLIEKHGSDLVIMDGIHRDYIAKQTGMALNAILIDNVSLPFPTSFHPWSEIRIIPLNEKPADINERYFDLNKNLFRDLKYLGIDG